MEAWDREETACANVDAAPLVIGQFNDLERHLTELRRTCQRGGELEVRRELQAMAWAQLDATLQLAPLHGLERLVELTQPHRRDMRLEHRQIDERVRHWAAARAAHDAAVTVTAAA